ncbi:hypothetical protein [Archangium sp.]|uniref:hypothetical protein n=1 Tax=Archangium sp. TaxID=1872627 RepID=UPI002D37A6EE|nr:hypothetical protein [Archangium sp.]HYO51892.1 hypothetical protein [Archangium sp.]
MSSVSRRESHLSAPTGLPVPDMGRSAGKQETPACAVQKNRVETYRGPEEQSRTQAHWSVHEQLERLPPADYRRMLERMDQGGLLGKYLDLEKMSPEARKEFLAQAERKGYVISEPGQKAPPAPCHPPDAPATYKNDAKLPESVRELLHESNRMAKRTYHDAHDAYVKRYSEQVMRAKSLGEIRSLGEPVAPFKVRDGLVHPHPDYERFRRSWSRVPGNDTRDDAYEAVSRRMADLSGQQRPGSFWFKAAAEMKAELGILSVKWGVEVLVTQEGQAKWEPKESAELAPGGVKVGAEPSGAGAPKVTVSVEHQPKWVKEKDPMTLGMSGDSEGSLRMDLPAGGGFGGHAEVNRKQGTYGGGVGFGRRLGEAGEVKVEAGFGMQGARRERARDVASKRPGTLFGPLPEQDQGLSWKDIPAGRRERMVRDGWTAESWAAELQKKSSHLQPR